MKLCDKPTYFCFIFQNTHQNQHTLLMVSLKLSETLARQIGHYKKWKVLWENFPGGLEEAVIQGLKINLTLNFGQLFSKNSLKTSQ